MTTTVSEPITTQVALAQHFGVAWQTVTAWKRRGAPIEKGEDGTFDPEPVREWLAARDQLPDSASSSDGGESAEEARRRLLIAQANEKEAQNELRRLKLAIQRGEYVPRSEVEERDIARIQVVKSGLESMPRRLAQELEGLTARQIEAALRTRFRELLERFASM